MKSKQPLKKLEILGGQFKKLTHLLEPISTWHTGTKDIEEIFIDNTYGISGDIEFRNGKTDKLMLSGVNNSNLLFENIVATQQITINNFVNNGTLKFYGIEPNKEVSNKTYFGISKSSLGKSFFFRVNFKDFSELNIKDSYMAESIFANIEWKESITAFDNPVPYDKQVKNETHKEISQIRESYRQLKIVMDKQGDKVQDHKFYSLEMNTYNRLLPWTSPFTDNFWNKLIIHSSRVLSDYGQSFVRPLAFLFLFSFIFFLILVVLFDYQSLQVVPAEEHDWSAFQFGLGEYFKLLNPLH